ncbi:Protein MEMO1 [Tolypocladium paradoxum]|uniref:Protein MEMO1 n=1 Tax=Tolypocladium paradoxum TaxID=94208 RepID=A0A2S4KPZ6_9HYPO|nr:Protein MEMO1 [Tolypocladium paradoxum]
MATRPAGKAGLWYPENPKTLEELLNGYLALVPETINHSSLPIPGARVIIAPHAGYEYSGECAAWAYSCLDLSKAKRVFVIGPSHTYSFGGCAVSNYAEYATPFGNLTVDRDTTQRIKEAGEMEDIELSNELEEHSLEMHMPYLYKCCAKAFGSPEEFPTIVPILIGSTARAEEKAVGRILLPYLKDPENAFIISSDFCHWGRRYHYMVYSAQNDLTKLTTLSEFDPRPAGPPIHETIRLLDEEAMAAVESGKHDNFVYNLKKTRNTVCGRHPIGIAMAALELLAKEANDETKYRFNVISYKRSNLVQMPAQVSVSYVSAYAVL